MIKTELKAVLDRVATWPEERQQELAEMALEIEAEMSENGYQASPDELKTIDAALCGRLASDEEVEAAFAALRRESGSSIPNRRFPTSKRLPAITPNRTIPRSGRGWQRASVR